MCMTTAAHSSTLSSQQGKVWFITGASTGFGRLLAEHLVRIGANVVATARDVSKLDSLRAMDPARVQTLSLDVTKDHDIDAAVKDMMARFGHVDVLVNNAGYGLMGAVEEVDEHEYMQMFETNVFGLIKMTKELLPQFRERRRGNIVMLSSIGGLTGLPGWGYYNASKFAVEGLSEALAVEMKPFGVHVTIVEPGPFRTDFLGRSGVASKHIIPEYNDTAGKTRQYFETQAGKQAGDPQKAVEAIVAAVAAPAPPLHLLLGKLAYDRYQAKVESFGKDVEAWKETTLGADFEE
jgi:NAD(P)-dependent dehydrogenase (short-subunit alcohol dehydrogenase family)